MARTAVECGRINRIPPGKQDLAGFILQVSSDKSSCRLPYCRRVPLPTLHFGHLFSTVSPTGIKKRLLVWPMLSCGGTE